MTNLEQVVTTHLEQSGGIQSDLAWLKKAMWVLVGGMVTFTVTFMSSLALYLIKR